jgi:Heavy metal binding domain
MTQTREQEDAWEPRVAMQVRKLLIARLVAGTLLLSGSPVYSVPGIVAAQKERSAHPKKPLKFHYVCPMHEDITSQKRGTCPKCKMKLVKKPVS